MAGWPTAVVVVGALTAASCAVDSDGVIRSVTAEEQQETDEGFVEVDGDQCSVLLERLQSAAVDVVGPSGFIGLDGSVVQGRFGGVAFERGIDFGGFGGFAGGQPGLTATVGSSSIVVGDLLAIERGGRLYVVGADGGTVGSVWLDALPEQRWPAPSTGLIARADDVIAVSPAVPLVDEDGDRVVATVIQRIDVSDAESPVIMERLAVRGEIAGSADSGEAGSDGAVRLALSIPAPQLDFLIAATEGGEEAATVHNQSLLVDTELSDWLGGYELTVAGDGDGEPAEPVTGLLGGCEVLAPGGAEAAVGATVLLDLADSGSLVDVEAQTILGQGQVAYDGDRVFVLSPRSHALGFTEPGRSGAPRVVISRVVDDGSGPSIDATGILAGSLFTLDPHPVGDDGLLVFTIDENNFEAGSVEVTSLVVQDAELAKVGRETLPLDQWDTFRSQPMSGRLLISGGQRSALLDIEDLSDISVAGIEPTWDRGNRIGAPQLTDFGDGAVLRLQAGAVSGQFGGIDNFLRSLGQGEFGFGWEPWSETQGPATLEVVRGDPLDGEASASYEATAFALWPVAVDPGRGRVVAGALGLVDDDTGERFDGALVLDIVDGEFIETARLVVEGPAFDNFGAHECEKADLEGVVSDILGVWNQTVLRCEPGQAGGMVGHHCLAFQAREISEREIQQWFGAPNPDAAEQLADFQDFAAEGGSLQSCTPQQPGGPSVPRSFVGDETGGWLVSWSAVHPIDGDGQIVDSIPLEPPYTA